jgi:Caspase domain
MTRHTRSSLILCLIAAGALAQGGPPNFQLILPDFAGTPIEGVTILPDRPIQRLSVLVPRNPEREIPTSGVRMWVNGKGMGNVLDSRGITEGLLLTMDPANLKKRPDELFDPIENTIEVQATDKQSRTYYQSWILRTGGGENAFFTYSSVVSPNDPAGVPPDLIVEEPRVPPVLSPDQASARITVRGKIASAHPATALKANGQTLKTVQEASASFQQNIDIRRDMKEIVLEAIDQRNNRRSVIIPLVIQQKQTAKIRFAGARYAFVVGISKYGDAKDAPPPLPLAAPAAAELARSLQEGAGFRKENIRVLMDEQATRDQIRAGFSDFAAKAQGDDLLVIYVAAYGLHDPRPGKSDRIYLAPHGTQLSQVEATALTFDDLEMWLSRYVKCNQTFLIFDVAHEVTGNYWKFSGPNLVSNHVLNLFSDQAGRAVLVSGSAGQVSRNATDGKSLAFTRWMSHALAGEADLNLDRVVTAGEFFRFVTEKVREESNGAQTPRSRLPKHTADSPVGEIAR